MAIFKEATADDCQAIADIYRYYVDNTVVTFDETAPSVADWQARVETVTSVGRPFLVAVDEADGTVIGFGYLSSYRPKAGYAWCAEDAVYLAADRRGHGIASELLEQLVNYARLTDIRQIVSVVPVLDDASSVRMRERLGFRNVGVITRNGYKHGHWIDCAYLQLDLPGTVPAA